MKTSKQEKRVSVKKAKKDVSKKSGGKKDIGVRVQEACSAIFKYEKAQKQAEDLLEDDKKRGVFLNFTFTRSKAEADKAPTYVDTPFPVYDLDDVAACFICKSPQREWKDRLAKEEIPMIQKIIDLGKLRTRYVPSTSRNELRKQFDLFFMDANIADQVVPFLGQSFRARAQKMPIAVQFTKEQRTEPDVPLAPAFLEKASQTRFIFSVGNNISVRIGQQGFEPERLAANAEAVYKYVTNLLEERFNKEDPDNKWAIQQVQLRLTDSLIVPIIQNLVQKQE